MSLCVWMWVVCSFGKTDFNLWQCTRLCMRFCRWQWFRMFDCEYSLSQYHFLKRAARQNNREYVVSCLLHPRSNSHHEEIGFHSFHREQLVSNIWWKVTVFQALVSTAAQLFFTYRIWICMSFCVSNITTYLLVSSVTNKSWVAPGLLVSLLLYLKQRLIACTRALLFSSYLVRSSSVAWAKNFIDLPRHSKSWCH
jgi:hypothetical protein